MQQLVTNLPSNLRSKGFSLIELMIAVAIVSLLAFIAIPAYNGYTREARYGAARANMGSLRIALEDFRLDNATYRVDDENSFNPEDNDKEEDLGWAPDGDGDNYFYTVTATSNSYDVLVRIGAVDSATWVLCKDRMNDCCDNKTAGATPTTCP